MLDAEQRPQIAFVSVGEQQSVSGNDIDQASKRSLNGRQIFKNISVIELQVIYDHDFRKVVDELAPLIKKCGVIFVPFNDEPFRISKSRTLAQIIGNAPDQKTWFQSPLCSNTHASSDVVVVFP